MAPTSNLKIRELLERQGIPSPKVDKIMNMIDAERIASEKAKQLPKLAHVTIIIDTEDGTEIIDIPKYANLALDAQFEDYFTGSSYNYEPPMKSLTFSGTPLKNHKTGRYYTEIWTEKN